MESILNEVIERQLSADAAVSGADSRSPDGATAPSGVDPLPPGGAAEASGSSSTSAVDSERDACAVFAVPTEPRPQKKVIDAEQESQANVSQQTTSSATFTVAHPTSQTHAAGDIEDSNQQSQPSATRERGEQFDPSATVSDAGKITGVDSGTEQTAQSAMDDAVDTSSIRQEALSTSIEEEEPHSDVSTRRSHEEDLPTAEIQRSAKILDERRAPPEMPVLEKEHPIQTTASGSEEKSVRQSSVLDGEDANRRLSPTPAVEMSSTGLQNQSSVSVAEANVRDAEDVNVPSPASPKTRCLEGEQQWSHPAMTVSRELREPPFLEAVEQNAERRLETAVTPGHRPGTSGDETEEIDMRDVVEIGKQEDDDSCGEMSMEALCSEIAELSQYGMPMEETEEIGNLSVNGAKKEQSGGMADLSVEGPKMEACSRDEVMLAVKIEDCTSKQVAHHKETELDDVTHREMRDLTPKTEESEERSSEEKSPHGEMKDRLRDEEEAGVRMTSEDDSSAPMMELDTLLVGVENWSETERELREKQVEERKSAAEIPETSRVDVREQKPVLLTDQNPGLSPDRNPGLSADRNPVLQTDQNSGLSPDLNPELVVDHNPILPEEQKSELSTDQNSTLTDRNPTRPIDPKSVLSIDQNLTLPMDREPTLPTDRNLTLAMDLKSELLIGRSPTLSADHSPTPPMDHSPTPPTDHSPTLPMHQHSITDLKSESLTDHDPVLPTDRNLSLPQDQKSELLTDPDPTLPTDRHPAPLVQATDTPVESVKLETIKPQVHESEGTKEGSPEPQETDERAPTPETTAKDVGKEEVADDSSVARRLQEPEGSVGTETERERREEGNGMSAECRRGRLLDRCAEAMRLCLARFPQHYKSLYRLAYLYKHSPQHRVSPTPPAPAAIILKGI